MAEAGDVNELLEHAKQIGEEQPTDEQQPTKTAPPKSAPFDPENPPIPDNGNASFERFMGSFGTPTRWAGR